MMTLLRFLEKPFWRHLLFWVVVYLFYVTSRKKGFETLEELFVTYVFHVSIQAMVAYAILLLIVPRYRQTKNVAELLAAGLLLLFVTNMVFVAAKMGFFESHYPCCYGDETEKYGHLHYFQRIFYLKSFLINDAFFYSQPLFFLVALQFYEKQQKMSEINEQKKIVELKALKNQLNPHFLFNTLNSLYALTIEQSDVAPEVVKRLSGILDYMLYRCDEQYVPIEKEIELIENYLALEQIRYEDRAIISLKNTVDRPVKIAPLLLLTFIENAFKHGVSQELGMATVTMTVGLADEDIVFTIANTKAPQAAVKPPGQKPIGLTNIERQLAFLYPNEHQLTIEDGDERYRVVLRLKQR